MTLRRTLALLLDSRTLLTLNRCEGCPCPECYELSKQRRELRSDLDEAIEDTQAAIAADEDERGALLAEVGTLRARVAELEDFVTAVRCVESLKKQVAVGESKVSFSTKVVTDAAGSFSMSTACCPCGWEGQNEPGPAGLQRLQRAAAEHERVCTWQPDREAILRRQAMEESR